MSKHPLEPGSRPEFFYKYRAIATELEKCRLLRVIKENHIYHPSPPAFNDPFDCKMPPVASLEPRFVRYLLAASKASNFQEHIDVNHRYVATRQRSKDELNDINADLSPDELTDFEVFKNDIQERVDNASVLSFSVRCDSILMWSHYTYNHTGICLKFSLKGWPTIGPSLYPVTYSEKRIPLALDENSFRDGQLVSAIALTKHRGWSYEEEWRLLGKAAGDYTFPPEALVGVIFGCMTSAADKQWIAEAVKGNPHIVLYNTNVKRDDFALEIVPV
jgi:hypothetical protein